MTSEKSRTGRVQQMSEQKEEDVIDARHRWPSETARHNGPNFKPDYVNLVLFATLMAIFFLLAAAVYVRDTFLAAPIEPATVLGGVNDLRSRTTIKHGDIFCVIEPSVTPDDFKLPREGICDAVVYCCLALNYEGIMFEDGSDVIRGFADLVSLTRSWKSSPTGIFAIVGRRPGTPRLRNLAGASSGDALVDLMFKWVTEHLLDGLFMDMDNSADGYYYSVMRLFHRKLHASGRWLIQIFDYNDAGRKFSAGAYVKSAMGPVVRSTHDSMKGYVDNAVCPMPYRAHYDIFWSVKSTLDEYASVNFASFGSEYLEDTILTMSFKGNHYRLNDSSCSKDECLASKVGHVSYGTLCQLRNESGVTPKQSRLSDCLLVWKGREWYSIVGPKSTRVYKLFASFLALVVYDLHYDDHAGVCGEPYPLLRDARKKVSKYAEAKEFQLN